MDQDLMMSIVGGWVVWAITWSTRRLIPDGEVKDAVRHWTPEIAAFLSVIVVGAWQAVEGGEILSLETLRRILSAATAAVFGHSLVQEKLKLAKKKSGDDKPIGPTGVAKVLIVVPLLLMLGCGGSTIQGLEYLPDVEIKSQDGCPDIMVKQLLPSPQGWTVMTATRIKKACESPDTPQTPPSE